MEETSKTPRHVVFKKKTLPTVPLSPLQVPRADVLLAGSSDEDSEGTRRIKRRRREDACQYYLRHGVPKFISTAQLKGPFQPEQIARLEKRQGEEKRAGRLQLRTSRIAIAPPRPAARKTSGWSLECAPEANEDDSIHPSAAQIPRSGDRDEISALQRSGIGEDTTQARPEDTGTAGERTSVARAPQFSRSPDTRHMTQAFKSPRESAASKRTTEADADAASRKAASKKRQSQPQRLSSQNQRSLSGRITKSHRHNTPAKSSMEMVEKDSNGRTYDIQGFLNG